MDEYAEFGDGSAGEFGGGVRSLFGSVVAGTTPVVGFTPASVATAGRTRQRRRRAGAVLGATASVVAVALAVSPFGGGGGGASAGSGVGLGTAAGTPRTTMPTTAAVPTPAGSAPTTSDLPEAPKDRSKNPAEDRQNAEAVFTAVRKDLDPAGKNLTAPGTPSPMSSAAARSVLAGWSFAADWTADGAPPAGTADAAYVALQIDIAGPDVLDQFGGSSNQIANGTAVAWGPKTARNLSDGSVVSTASVTTTAGTSMVVERRWPDGRSVVVHLDDASATGIPGYPAAVKQPSRPFPFTEQSLAQALSDPALPAPPTYR